MPYIGEQQSGYVWNGTQWTAPPGAEDYAAQLGRGWGQTIAQRFQALLGRTPDPDELYKLSNAMQQGYMTVPDMDKMIQGLARTNPTPGGIDRGTYADPAGTIPGSPPTQPVPNGGFAGANQFLHGLRPEDLADTVRRDRGDLSNAAQSMIGNAESQAGGRYNPANRDMFAQAADDLKGLFALDSVTQGIGANPDTASQLGAYLGNRMNGQGTGYDQSQVGRLNGALGALESGPGDANRNAFLSDPTAQTLALRTALQRSVNPLLAQSAGTRVNELASQYNTIDTTRGPNNGGFLRFAKNAGLF